MKTTTHSLRRLGLLAPLLAVGLGGFALHVERSRRVAIHRIEEVRARLAEERSARDASREALWGETTEGPAWPHYAAALEAFDEGWLRGGAGIERLLGATATDDGGAGAEERARLAAEGESVLAALRAGAHARDAAVGLAWDQGSLASHPKLVTTRKIGGLALCRLLEARDGDAWLDGVRTLLDAQQLGRDLMVGPSFILEMIGCDAVVPAGVLDHLEQGLADRMPRAAKVAWLDGLRRLEGSIPAASDSLAGELELFAAAVVEARRRGPAARSAALGDLAPRAWDALFVDRNVEQYLDLMETTRGRYAHAFELPAGEVLPAIRALVTELETSSNPVLRTGLPRLDSMALSRLWNRGRLSFLRHALELHLGIEGAPPLDPFGTGVTVEREGGRIRVRTTWPDAWGAGRDLVVVL